MLAIHASRRAIGSRRMVLAAVGIDVGKVTGRHASIVCAQAKRGA
jgi:hypothetical protein